MKKISAYLQKPINISDSAYYKYLQKYPSLNVKYISNKNFDVITKNIFLKKIIFAKKIIKSILRKFSLSIPNAYRTQTHKKYDLIHCMHCLSKNKHPWVVDIEYSNQFWIGGCIKNHSKKSIYEVGQYLNSKYYRHSN